MFVMELIQQWEERRNSMLPSHLFMTLKTMSKQQTKQKNSKIGIHLGSCASASILWSVTVFIPATWTQ
jgi:hypothetical protein